MKRRDFLSTTAKGAAGLAIASNALSAQRVAGANERIHIGLIGCGGRGTSVLERMIEAGARLHCLCDLRDDRMDKSESRLRHLVKERPKRYKDMRKCLEQKDLDAVIVATPDHWHAGATILAIQAGKDVYVEKPHAHNIWESQQMILAAEKAGKILQVGTQNRSAPYNHAALKVVQSGRLGKIALIKAFNMQSGNPFYLGETGPIPAGFDWKEWLGPAPHYDYHDRLFAKGWRHYWDFSQGLFSDDGIHILDLALMMMGDIGLPKGISCTAGRLVHTGDDSKLPDTQNATYDFGNSILTFEFTSYPKYMAESPPSVRDGDRFPYWPQNATRIEIYGSELMMTLGRHGGGWKVTTKDGEIVEGMYGRRSDREHVENFLGAIKGENKLNAPIDIAHNAHSMICMANIAHRVGNVTLKWDDKKNRFSDNDEANQLIKRQYTKGYEFSA